MLRDEKEDVRRMAVLRIQQAREVFNSDVQPWQFIPPQLNLQVKLKFELL